MTAPQSLTDLAHWERSGGTWELGTVRDGVAEVRLLRCDGGEQVDRLGCPVEDLLIWAVAQADKLS